MDEAAKRAMNVIDTHVGQRVRTARKALAMSQTKLADELGLTFQQIQKYERGFNRIAVSTLFAISRILSKPVPWFFEGLADAPIGEMDVGAAAFARNVQEAAAMVPQIARIPSLDRATRRAVGLVLSGLAAGAAAANPEEVAA